MTRAADPPASRTSLRDEAATWFAVMRGPEAETRRAEFEAWLDREAIHREAYSRISETFSLGKALKTADLETPTEAIRPVRSPRRAWAAALLLIAAAAAVMIWGAIRQNQAFAPSPQLAHGDTGQQRLATRIGEIRQFRLADGSVATLDTDSLLLVSLDGSSRNLTLARGRARFSVAHEKRPFFVHAAGGTVTAVGTLFDVSLAAGGRVDIRLLKGVILVDMGGRKDPGGVARRLDPGEALSFGGAAGPALTSTRTPSDANWPAGVRDFDGVRVADVIEDANRYTAVPLRAATSDIADTRISGAFRVDDGAALAANIADVLGLAQMISDDGITLMHACPRAAQENCKAPS